VSATDYAFGVDAPNNDAIVQKPYPGLVLYGTELTGQNVDIREISGLQWFVLNGIYNANLQGYTQQLVTAPSFAMVIGPTGISTYTAAAGAANPIVWLGGAYYAPVYNNAGASLSSNVHLEQGTVTAVGASTTITLTGKSVYTGATTYTPTILDTTTGAYATGIVPAAASFTFTSVTGHVYTWSTIGY
jgi:hypothetical protein